jgi:hypothetical protein
MPKTQNLVNGGDNPPQLLKDLVGKVWLFAIFRVQHK